MSNNQEIEALRCGDAGRSGGGSRGGGVARDAEDPRVVVVFCGGGRRDDETQRGEHGQAEETQSTGKSHH